MREAIVKELVEAVKEIAGEGYVVSKSEVKKNNGVELLAIIVRTPEEVVSPTIYVDKFVEDIEKEDMTVMEAAQRVFDIYQENKNPALGIDIKKLTDREYILENVEYQLVNAERNAEKLKGVPGKKVADLVAIYRTVVKKDENGVASYILSNEQLNMAGISVEEIDEAAKRNTLKSGFLVRTMCEIMAEMMGMDKEDAEAMSDVPWMLVLTNDRKTNGANILLYNEKLEEVAERLQGDFYILPSSIHEVLAIPAKDAEPEQLRAMVKEVNDNEVAPEEILGYEVYRYNRETGEIEVAA